MRNQITRAFDALGKKAMDQKLRMSIVEKNMDDYQKKLDTLETDIQMYHEARQLFIEAAKFTREKTIAKVEHNLSAALKAIFQDPTMNFKIDIREKRAVLQAEFFVAWEENGHRIERDPLVAKGGSIVDVVTTGLRLVFLKSNQPAKRPILFLDEPGKFLDSERRARYGQWIYQISHELGIQVVMITHDEELKAVADRMFRLRPDPKKGVTVETSDPTERNLDGYGFQDSGH